MTPSRRDLSAVPDEEIVARVLSGDVEAFAGIVHRYHARCLRYAERMLGDRPDAEDAVQDALVLAYGGLVRYEERARFSAWLFAIVANACRAAARARGTRARLTVLDENATHRAVAPAPSGDIDDGDRLDVALRRLEPSLREAFILRHVEELSYEEMRVATGAGISALKMRVKRACDSLRALLEDR
ncbi:MAG TPA: RNA polymerase sigma factor [Gemmatimonadaceae bacterium]|nr:RNA polymerase sigma factor [Gemmatimonadaceae bacterium]